MTQEEIKAKLCEAIRAHRKVEVKLTILNDETRMVEPYFILDDKIERTFFLQCKFPGSIPPAELPLSQIMNVDVSEHTFEADVNFNTFNSKRFYVICNGV